MGQLLSIDDYGTHVGTNLLTERALRLRDQLPHLLLRFEFAVVLPMSGGIDGRGIETLTEVRVVCQTTGEPTEWCRTQRADHGNKLPSFGLDQALDLAIRMAVAKFAPLSEQRKEILRGLYEGRPIRTEGTV